MNESISNAEYDKNTWATPQWFFDDCNSIWQFNIDVCALEWNCKCERYFTPEQDALKQVLTHGDRAWMNPPYSNPGKWVEWAEQQSQLGALVVGLLSCNGMTSWFGKVNRKPRTEIHFIEKRLSFVPPLDYNGKPNQPFFASCLVVWYPKTIWIKR